MVSGICSLPTTTLHFTMIHQTLKNGKFSSIDDQRNLAILRRVFGETHICTVKELISRMPSDERVKYDQIKAQLFPNILESPDLSLLNDIYDTIKKPECNNISIN